MRVLVVNAGSSSLKLRLLDESDQVVWSHDAPAPDRLSDADVAKLLLEAPEADAVGHRVVHDGGEFHAPVLLDDDVLDRLEQFTDLAPLHQPPAVRVARITVGVLSRLPAVACFDTTFHRTLPPAAVTYPLPAAWREEFPLRRYGFHGLSHAWVARRVSELAGGVPERLVSCHLGAGSSLTAIQQGRAVDTTMGFTPLEGVMMATRSGSVDPGLLLWLIRHAGLDPAEVERGLEYESGLAGLAGTADLRDVLAQAAAGANSAALAVEVLLRSLRAGVAAMATALNGIDALAFTGGIGENAPAIRARVAAGLTFLGVTVDAELNQTCQPDAEITASDGSVRVFVIAAREDREIARGVRDTLAHAGDATRSWTESASGTADLFSTL